MSVPDLVYNVRANDKSRAAFESNRRALQKTRRETQLLNYDMGVLSRSVSSIKGGAIAAVTSAVVALTAASRKAVVEGSKLAKVADRVGLTTEELQRLRYGFELTGVEAGTTDTAMQRFARRVGEAANGSGVLYEILKANGVQLRDVTGKMKSQSQILGEYADLIKNASSEQEQLLLAFKAFDREGAGLVLALKGGADGVRDLMRAADDAGGVLEEELLRTAERIDDEFAALWRTFETGAKRATLNTVSWLDQLRTHFRTFQDQQASMAELGAFVGASVDGRSPKGDRFDDFSGRIGRGFAMVVLNRNRPTVIPKKGKGQTSTRTSQDPYARVLKQLEHERDLLGMNAQEQRRANALRLAGVEASSKQGQELIKLTDEIHAQTQAQQQANETAALLGEIGQDSLTQFIQALGLADTAAGRLVATLAEAALQAAFLGQGPLAGLMGSSPESNLSTALMSGFKGFFAKGGVLGAGEWGFAGENGPEPVVGPAKIISNKDAFASGQGSVVVQQYIQTPDVESFRQSQGQVAAMMVDALSRGRRNR